MGKLELEDIDKMFDDLGESSVGLFDLNILQIVLDCHYVNLYFIILLRAILA